ncbi:DGQHR domain-containing protein [Methylorubrum populi]|uniref:DGQHR domain-containing protein n=1 Tax=Methylorubrum populi TaxID=223967 RepID=UPI00114EE560|nr:DGQHR domain-containing protein [Methylorubrum populi]QDI82363.1 DGQHR domain-containing protein [Methylorubrum populi]
MVSQLKVRRKKVVAQSEDPVETESDGRRSFAASLLSQGDHRFYTLSMPSEILAETCIIESRDENPLDGFQRALDEKRARDIANYIDSGRGTIPSSIVLSAQPEANLKYNRPNRTLAFDLNPRAFLIIDGQHRVYGFHLAKSSLRVPVVVYSGLTRTEEARLFIDINTKQRPVPNELLLDIKRLAALESGTEALSKDVFDKLHSDPKSPLFGLTSSTEKQKGKLSRVTFDHAIKSVSSSVTGLEASYVYEIVSSYIQAGVAGLRGHGLEASIVVPTVFRALFMLFPTVAERVSDRYDGDYSVEHFSNVLMPMFEKIKKSDLEKPGSSINNLHDVMQGALKSGFVIAKRKAP